MTVRATLLCAGLLGCGAAPAADDAQLAQCAAIADPAARLACYDTLAGRPADVDAVAHFGLASQPAPVVATPDKMEARIAGQPRLFERGMVVKLDNGQAWKLVGDDRAYFNDVPANPEVSITKGFLGTYWMEVIPIKRRFKVRRVD